MPPAPVGNIKLPPTSKTPQPHAHAHAAPGAKTPASKPTPIFFIREFNLLFFIFKVQVARTPNGVLKSKGNGFSRASNDAGNQTVKLKRRNGAAAAPAAFGRTNLRKVLPARRMKTASAK